MQVTIAVDPGYSTGIAIFANNDLLATMTTHPPHSELERTLLELPRARVVCEQGPTVHRHQPDTVTPVEEMVRRHANDLEWVRPSEWKGSPLANPVEADFKTGLSTKHERDALGMGRWFLRTHV